MHRCLLLDEILREIAECLCDDWDPEKGVYLDGSLRAAARLSRCCKVMEEPVLEVLWGRSQRSFSTLLRLLPSHLLYVDKANKLCFSKDPVPEDWSRFNLYAKRMRRIALFFLWPSDPGQISMETWQTISRCNPSRPLVPMLKRLDWLLPTNENPYLALFLHAGLSTINIAEIESPFTSILSLSQAAPDLMGLSFVLDEKTSNPSLFEGLSRFQRLRSFTVYGSLPDAGIRGVSQLPHLEEFFCDGVVLHSNTSAIPPIFPSLRVLKGTWKDMENTMYFLGQVETQVLQVLEVHLQSSLEMTQMRSFTALADRKHFSKSVTCLKLSHLPPSAETHDAFNLTSNMIFSFVAVFQNLTLLHLPQCCSHGTCRFALDDASIEMLAQELPKIQDLDFGCPGPVTLACGSSSIKVTLEGLKSFATHCPELRELTIHVNASVVPSGILKGFDIISSPPCVLNKLTTGISCVAESTSEQAAISFILLHLFPSLAYIVCGSSRSGWKLVNENLQACRKVID